MRRNLLVLALALATSACSTVNGLRTPLSARPVEPAQMERALLATLNSAVTLNENRASGTIATPNAADIATYLNAGYTLTDIYCDRFFRAASESRQRRAYSRTLFNDVGAAMSAALGLSGASPDVIAGVATATGLSDSAWQNYDRSFVVAPELGQVRLLVLSAQDEFRRTNATPNNLYAAQSMIVRYAGLCSYVGMQGLLTDSLGRERARIELNQLGGQSRGNNAQGTTETNGNSAPTAAGQPIATPPGQTPPRP
jgi:hypothetical protein